MTVPQLDTLPTKPLREAAIFPVEPEATGLRFEGAVDDLDAYRWAAFELDGDTFALIRYQSTLEPGVLLWAPEGMDAGEAAKRVAGALGLPEPTWAGEPTPAHEADPALADSGGSDG